LVVREKIDYFISEGFTPLAIYKWLEENLYPKWREEGKDEFCVTRRTIYNYMKNRCPENMLVSDTYLQEARKRVDDDVDSLFEIRESIKILDKLILSFDLKDLSLGEKGELRRLLHEKIESQKKYMELQMRLGLVKETEKEDSTEDILEKLKKAQDEKRRKEEEDALKKVVEL